MCRGGVAPPVFFGYAQDEMYVIGHDNIFVNDYIGIFFRYHINAFFDSRAIRAQLREG